MQEVQVDPGTRQESWPYGSNDLTTETGMDMTSGTGMASAG